MACIFSSCDDVDKAATTLTGILCSDDDDNDTNTNNLSPSPSPSSVNYADEEVELVRTAMRGNKRERNDDDDEEKWICYSEVVERKEIGGMMLSSSSSTSTTRRSCCYDDDGDRKRSSKLVLKLDYEKIMKTWVNKGPLYIHSGLDHAPQLQTVPDAQDDHDFFSPSSIHVRSFLQFLSVVLLYVILHNNVYL